MRNLLLYSSALTLLWTATACQKEVTQQQSTSQQLTKTSAKEGDSLYITYYDYDIQNHLVAVSGSDNQGQGKENYLTIHYDAQGRMDSATTMYGGSYSFQYDNQNRIIQKLPTFSSTPYPGKHTYAYDAKSRLIADTTHSYWADEVFEYTTYTYDQDDNIAGVQVFRNNGGMYRLEKSLQVQFDNKRNPYYSLGRQLYYAIDYLNGGEFLLSKHNRVKETFANGDVVTYSYVYDSDWPKSSAMTDSSDPGWILNMSFNY